MTIGSIEALQAQLREKLYIADRGLATAMYLALKLERPLFLEGEAGVGKTEIAKVLTEILDTELIRLQCYEGLDVNQAVYEWKLYAADDAYPPRGEPRREARGKRSLRTGFPSRAATSQGHRPLR